MHCPVAVSVDDDSYPTAVPREILVGVMPTEGAQPPVAHAKKGGDDIHVPKRGPSGSAYGDR